MILKGRYDFYMSPLIETKQSVITGKLNNRITFGVEDRQTKREAAEHIQNACYTRNDLVSLCRRLQCCLTSFSSSSQSHTKESDYY